MVSSLLLPFLLRSHIVPGLQSLESKELVVSNLKSVHMNEVYSQFSRKNSFIHKELQVVLIDSSVSPGLDQGMKIVQLIILLDELESYLVTELIS